MAADSEIHTAGLDSILDRYARDPNALLQILREVQELHGYISPAAISHIGVKLGIPRAQVEGVAGFYSFLHLQPNGEYRVLFSDNITDRRSEEHTSELQSPKDLVCRLLLEKKKK